MLIPFPAYLGSSLPLSKKFLNARNVKFEPHDNGDSSWLGMELDFQHVEPIFNALNSTKEPLLTRGKQK
jgi:hypothetical protein